jgi:predicted MFS family arabinose efflux permease
VRLPEQLGALREREFRLLFFGQSISLLGDGMVPLAISFAVLGLTGSASDVGFVLAARWGPLVAFLLVGGVFADRLPRRAVMIAADLVRFAGQGVAAALLITGDARVWQLVLLQAVHGAASGFFSPASTGLLPQTISAGRLQEANALAGLARSTGNIAGPAIAGALVATVGSGWAIAADAATFAVSALFLAQLRLAIHDRAPNQTFFRDLVAGWDEFRKRTWLWAVVLWAALYNMLAAPSFLVLGVVVAERALGGPSAWALITSVFGFGSLVGGLVALRIRPRRPLVLALAGVFFQAPPLALLAVEAPAGVIAVFAFIAGAAFALFLPLWETTLQREVPPAALSRVSSYDWFGSLAFLPLGYALVGPIAAQLGVSATLWLAAVWALASTSAVLALPSVRRLRAPSASARA